MGFAATMLRTFPLVEVRGSSYEMGLQHGEQADTRIGDYLHWIERLTKQPRRRLTRNAMTLLPHIKDVSARFVEEVRGLADGAGITFEEAVLCQARAEAAGVAEGGCTSFALTREATVDGRTLIGQNQDLEADYEDVAILLRVEPDDGRPGALMFTFAGQLGYSGMNSLGVAHFANALYGVRWRPGSPHYPLKRVALEQSSVPEVIDLIRRVRVCSAGNMIIADRSGAIADVEIFPNAVAGYADSHPDRLIHSNHCLSPELRSRDDPLLPDSVGRLNRMRDLVGRHWGSIDVEALKEFLADHHGHPAGICRHGAADMHSISGYIAEPEAGIMHVRRGHGCDGDWTAYQV